MVNTCCGEQRFTHLLIQMYENRCGVHIGECTCSCHVPPVTVTSRGSLILADAMLAVATALKLSGAKAPWGRGTSLVSVMLHDGTLFVRAEIACPNTYNAISCRAVLFRVSYARLLRLHTRNAAENSPLRVLTILNILHLSFTLASVRIRDSSFLIQGVG